MSNEEIIEGNRLIAQFAGWYRKDKRCKEPLGMLMIPERYMFDDEDAIRYDWDKNYLCFHSSWDWLMPVVEKIESLDKIERVSHTYSIIITGNGTTVYKNVYSHGEDNIIFRKNITNERLYCTWFVVVEFIKWYNKQKGETNE